MNPWKHSPHSLEPNSHVSRLEEKQVSSGQIPAEVQSSKHPLENPLENHSWAKNHNRTYLRQCTIPWIEYSAGEIEKKMNSSPLFQAHHLLNQSS